MTSLFTETRGAFSSDEYARRVAEARSRMAEMGIDALALTTPENIYYLIGLSHQGYFAFTMLLLPAEGKPMLVTRQMERITLAQQAPGVEHVGYEDNDDAGTAVVAAARKAGLASSRVGVDTTSVFFPPDVWEALHEGLPAVEWVDTSRSSSTDPTLRHGLVDAIRLIKSEAELDYTRRAAAISDRAARAGLQMAGPGVNEREIAAAVYEAMILAGGEYPGFAPFIRSADFLMQEHTTWRDRSLTAGDKLFIELSGSAGRYHAPLGRMVHIARAPDEAENLFGIATGAMEAARETLRPGVTTGAVYDAWQEVVDDGLGPGRLRRHHCGYAVGIGFPPSWVGSSTVLGIRPGGRVEVHRGMVFHLLSWITDPELGDYLASDTAIVHDDGAEYITTTPWRLVES